MAIDPKININENQVIFRGNTGHRHDGLTSTLIDTTKYSMTDFVVYPTAPPGTARRNFQQNNLDTLSSFIVEAIERRVLNPQGIRLRANTITANEIAANTITADELAANIVLVKNIIKSNNYSIGSAGWIINGNGTAEFSNVTVRGTVVANAGAIGNILVNSTAIYSSVFNATEGFKIYSNGFADFNDISIRGNIEATSGNIGGILSDSSNFYTSNYNGTSPSYNGTEGFILMSNGYANFTNIKIGANATIGDNLYVSNYLRINTPQPSNVTVVKISGLVNPTSNIADQRYSFVIESPNGNNILEVRDDRRVSITGNLFVNGSSVTTGGPYLALSGGTLTGILNGTSIDMSNNVRYGGQVYSDAADGYAEFGAIGSPTTIGSYVFRINQVESLWDRSFVPSGSDRDVHINSTSTLFVGANVSSERYKNSITSCDLDVDNFLKIDIVNFYYNDELWDYESHPEKELQTGIIVEQLDELGLTDMVVYDELGRPDRFKKELFNFYLFKTCQAQQIKIEELEARLQAIEGV